MLQHSVKRKSLHLAWKLTFTFCRWNIFLFKTVMHEKSRTAGLCHSKKKPSLTYLTQVFPFIMKTLMLMYTFILTGNLLDAATFARRHACGGKMYEVGASVIDGGWDFSVRVVLIHHVCCLPERRAGLVMGRGVAVGGGSQNRRKKSKGQFVAPAPTNSFSLVNLWATRSYEVLKTELAIQEV